MALKLNVPADGDMCVSLLSRLCTVTPDMYRVGVSKVSPEDSTFSDIQAVPHMSQLRMLIHLRSAQMPPPRVWCTCNLVFAAPNTQPRSGRQPSLLSFCGLLNRGIHCCLPPPALPQGAPTSAPGEHAGASPEPSCPHPAALPERFFYPTALPVFAEEDYPATEQSPRFSGQVRPTEGKGSLILQARRSLGSNSEFPVSGGMQTERSFHRKDDDSPSHYPLTVDPAERVFLSLTHQGLLE